MNPEHEEEEDLHEDWLEDASPLLACSFNQSGSALACGTVSGFSVHDLTSGMTCTERRLSSKGIGGIQMLQCSQIVALVGGGPSPYALPHRVVLWDDHRNAVCGEVCFPQGSVVLRVVFGTDRMGVALCDRVFIYRLQDLALLQKLYTADNPRGLLSLSSLSASVSLSNPQSTMACPTVTKGQVRAELYASNSTALIQAHKAPLGALELTPDGTTLATASVKGTVIRVWNVATSACTHQFRRGVERATVTCLSWSRGPDFAFLSCTSDRGTTHVFERTLHPSSKLRKSLCQIKGVPHPMVCSFMPNAANRVAVAGRDTDGNGVVLISDFLPDGTIKRVAYRVLCHSKMRMDEETRRRRRLLKVIPKVPQTSSSDQLLQVGDRFESHTTVSMEDHHDDNELVSVHTFHNMKESHQSTAPHTAASGGQSKDWTDTTDTENKQDSTFDAATEVRNPADALHC